MQLELNYTWIQELLEKIRIKVSVSNLDNYQELLFLEFKHYIHDALHNKLGSKEGKEPKWNLDEFLTLCVIFHIEEVLSKLKIQEIQEINEEKYHIRKYRNTYILNLKPSENLNKYKNWLPNFKDLKIEGVESYYEANQRLLKSLLKQKSINHSLTPFQWIALVRNAFFCDSTKKYIMAEKSLNVSQK